MSNELRMPFAEWLGRMCEEGVSPMARALAVYTAAFKTHSNAELEMLSGIEGKTYNKYKRELRDDGWFVLAREEREKGGRGIGFEPLPAYHKTMVKFTDLIPRKGGKYYPGKEEVDTPVIPTMVGENTPVISTPVKESPPHTPFKENKLITVEKQHTTTTTVEYDAASGGGEVSDYLNGSAVDITAFISKHAMVDGKTAQSMLANNVKAFSADAMLEAYSLTLADMASSMIAKPYKYLIETARRLKEGRQKKQAVSGESTHDKIRRFAEQTEERMKRERRV